MTSNVESVKRIESFSDIIKERDRYKEALKNIVTLGEMEPHWRNGQTSYDIAKGALKDD